MLVNFKLNQPVSRISSLSTRNWNGTMNPRGSRVQVPATGGDWGLGFSYKINWMSKTRYWRDP